MAILIYVQFEWLLPILHAFLAFTGIMVSKIDFHNFVYFLMFILIPERDVSKNVSFYFKHSVCIFGKFIFERREIFWHILIHRGQDTKIDEAITRVTSFIFWWISPSRSASAISLATLRRRFWCTPKEH